MELWDKICTNLRARTVIGIKCKDGIVLRNTYLDQQLILESRQSELMDAGGNSQCRYESELNYNPMSHGKRIFLQF
ncbi:RING-type E3 ubiquitin transferase [Trifolium repens]|nr:RING-type E3 ubiquitin transferase [Trifolium repens]